MFLRGCQDPRLDPAPGARNASAAPPRCVRTRASCRCCGGISAAAVPRPPRRKCPSARRVSLRAVWRSHVRVPVVKLQAGFPDVERGQYWWLWSRPCRPRKANASTRRYQCCQISTRRKCTRLHQRVAYTSPPSTRHFIVSKAENVPSRQAEEDESPRSRTLRYARQPFRHW